ncbi:MAG: hypothetical protein K2H93_06210 [Oscillospiraceae bacterium]|nr:hypothetical protein [Oscillospiraceae bacterium]
MNWYDIYKQFLIVMKENHAMHDVGYQQQLFQILEQMDYDPNFEIDWDMIEQLEKEFAE